MEISSLAMIPMSDYHCHSLPAGTNAAVKSHIPDVFVQTKKFGGAGRCRILRIVGKYAPYYSMFPLSGSIFFE